MGTRTLKAIQNTYAMLFVVVFLGLQATLAFATPLEQERFFDLDQERFFDFDQERFFDLCEKITAITIKDWICGTTTSTIPPTTTTEETSTLPPEFITTSTTEEVTTTTSTIPSTTTTEEITTTTSTLPPTTTTEEITTTTSTLPPPTGGKCYAIGEHAGMAGWNMWCQVNCNQVPITNCPADQCACQKN